MKKFFRKLALVAVAVLGVEASASAQLGGIIGAIANMASSDEVETGIPQPKKKGKTSVFNWSGTPIGSWNPQTLEILFNQKWDEGELKGQYVIYKVDPQTGDIIRNDGTPKGKIYADGTFESPNIGTLKLEKSGKVYRGEECIGQVTDEAAWAYEHKFGSFNIAASHQIVAVVYFGLLCSENQLTTWKQEAEVAAAERAAQAAEAKRLAEEREQYEREHPTFYEISKNGGRGYVDSNGVVYDWAKVKIGQLPKKDGDILDKYGSRIGTVSFGGEDIKDRSGKLLCNVKSSGTICDGSQPHVSYAEVTVYGYVDILKDRKRLGQCDCKNPTWTAILIYCDFFKF